jgi:hypothetical protein
MGYFSFFMSFVSCFDNYLFRSWLRSATELFHSKTVMMAIILRDDVWKIERYCRLDYWIDLKFDSHWDSLNFSLLVYPVHLFRQYIHFRGCLGDSDRMWEVVHFVGLALLSRVYGSFCSCSWSCHCAFQVRDEFCVLWEHFSMTFVDGIKDSAFSKGKARIVRFWIGTLLNP